MGDFPVVPTAHLQKWLGRLRPPSPIAALPSVPPVNLPNHPGSMLREKRLCRMKLAQLLFLLWEFLLNLLGKGTWPACPLVTISFYWYVLQNVSRSPCSCWMLWNQRHTHQGLEIWAALRRMEIPQKILSEEIRLLSGHADISCLHCCLQHGLEVAKLAVN